VTADLYWFWAFVFGEALLPQIGVVDAAAFWLCVDSLGGVQAGSPPCTDTMRELPVGVPARTVPEVA